MTNNEQFPNLWCQMWNQEPSLAHRLVTDHGRQWASRTPGLDTVIGPGPTETFVETWSKKTGNTFRERVLAIGGDLVGYSWDVTKGDGRIVTGADFNLLDGGKVVDNWTFVTDDRDERPDPELEPADAAELDDLVQQDATERGVRVHRQAALDPSRGTAAYLWQADPEQPGGIEVISIRSGAVAWRLSLAAGRPFRY